MIALSTGCGTAVILATLICRLQRSEIFENKHSRQPQESKVLRVSLRLTLEKSDCCPIDVWSYVWRCQSGVLSDSSGPVARSAILMLPTMVIHVRAKPKDICAPAC